MVKFLAILRREEGSWELILKLVRCPLESPSAVGDHYERPLLSPAHSTGQHTQLKGRPPLV